MSDYEEIAERIARVILSPDSAIGFIHGVISVPIDIGYLVYGYLDTASRYTHEGETIRIIQAIRNGILDYERIVEAVDTVINQFDKYASESEQNRLYSRSSFSVVGRALTNSVISSKIATAIVGQASFATKLAGGLIGNILLAGGMMERSIRVSEQLSVDEPELYQILREKDYDLLYFLFEPALKPFVDALAVRRIEGDIAFNKILELVEYKVNQYYG